MTIEDFKNELTKNFDRVGIKTDTKDFQEYLSILVDNFGNTKEQFKTQGIYSEGHHAFPKIISKKLGEEIRNDLVIEMPYYEEGHRRCHELLVSITEGTKFNSSMKIANNYMKGYSDEARKITAKLSHTKEACDKRRNTLRSEEFKATTGKAQREKLKKWYHNNQDKWIERCNNPERCNKLSKSLKKFFSDPTNTKRMSDNKLEFYSNPDNLKKHTDIHNTDSCRHKCAMVRFDAMIESIKKVIPVVKKAITDNPNIYRKDLPTLAKSWVMNKHIPFEDLRKAVLNHSSITVHKPNGYWKITIKFA